MYVLTFMASDAQYEVFRYIVYHDNSTPDYHDNINIMIYVIYLNNISGLSNKVLMWLLQNMYTFHIDFCPIPN